MCPETDELNLAKFLSAPRLRGRQVKKDKSKNRSFIWHQYVINGRKQY